MRNGHCEHCARPSSEAATESAHYTSEGIVRYRRCPCGNRWLDLTRFPPA